MKSIYLLPLLALLIGCNPVKLPPEQYLALYYEGPVAVDVFQVCIDPGCENTKPVSMTKAEWRKLDSVMLHKARSAAAERQQVQQAIAQFEKTIGPKTNTHQDQARNDSYRGTPQLDCIAETVNTTTYLSLLDKRKLLRWHVVAEPRHRGPLELLAPHNTAVLREKSSNKEYAIDSWFHANGKPPEVVPVDDWVSGYDPDDAK